MPRKKVERIKMFHMTGNTMEQSVYLATEKEVGDFIYAEMDNNRNERRFEFKIRVNRMTQEEINDLPDYIG